jgi:uncharacterized protein YdhG (YjbR/CyaY superfamily)
MGSSKTDLINDYIADFPAATRRALKQILETVRSAAPGAAERISYGIPTFDLDGPLVYFGAFKEHIGFYPRVRDSALRKAVAQYANEKGNLRFPLDKPMPRALIRRIVKARIAENCARKAAAR